MTTDWLFVARSYNKILIITLQLQLPGLIGIPLIKFFLLQIWQWSYFAETSRLIIH